jgi:hypothetical protein
MAHAVRGGGPATRGSDVMALAAGCPCRRGAEAAMAAGSRGERQKPCGEGWRRHGPGKLEQGRVHMS